MILTCRQKTRHDRKNFRVQQNVDVKHDDVNGIGLGIFSRQNRHEVLKISRDVDDDKNNPKRSDNHSRNFRAGFGRKFFFGNHAGSTQRKTRNDNRDEVRPIGGAIKKPITQNQKQYNEKNIAHKSDWDAGSCTQNFSLLSNLIRTYFSNFYFSTKKFSVVSRRNTAEKFLRLTLSFSGDKIFAEGVIDLPIYNAQILTIDAAEVRRYAGLRKAKNFGEKNIRDACDEALLLSDVRGAWEIYDYKNFFVESEPPVELVGQSIVKHLAGCEKVICMAATVGFEIEREITKKFERGEYLSSVLLDAAATAAVEQAADELEKNFVAKFSKDGFKMRRRFSPGYGDWNLTEQEKIFKICGAEKIGITLSSALMLEPRKSVTAIIGLEKISAEKISSHEKKSCDGCKKFDCPARK